MSGISKFLENELDKINEHLSMVRGNLSVPIELCENKCSLITKELTDTDEKVIDFLNIELSKINSKIERAQELIQGFKDYYYDLKYKK